MRQDTQPIKQRSSTKRLTIFVSSTVYGYEELLDRIYTMLTAFGYEVWMSHKGTMPVDSHRTAFDNCLEAVAKCDLFLGIITPQYGSGQDKEIENELSIVHREIKKAIELKKPRWVLAHDHVVFARSLLKNLGYGTSEKRKELSLKKSPILEDLRVLDIYEDAAVQGKKIPLAERRGNWVQKFRSDEEGALFATAQFYRYQEIEDFIKENFGNNNMEASHGQE